MRKVFNYYIGDFINLYLPIKYRSEMIINWITTLCDLKEFRKLYNNTVYDFTFTAVNNVITVPFLPFTIEPFDTVLIFGDINASTTQIVTTNNISNSFTVTENINNTGTLKVVKQNYYLTTKSQAGITGQKRVLEIYLRSFFNTNKINIIISDSDITLKYIYKENESYEPLFFYNEAEGQLPFYIYKENEIGNMDDFIIEVKTSWQNTNNALEIIKLVDKYKMYNSKYSLKYVL